MDIPSLKYITQAGGKLSNELTLEFINICLSKGIEFYVMYGQTEATARISYLPWKYVHSKIGSIGIAIPGGKLWLEDGNKNKINENDIIGELVYEGDNVTMGYSRDCFDLQNTNHLNRILYTGDMAKIDKDGFYFITGRKKRFVKIYGNRVSLDDIEELLKNAGYECICAGYDDNLKIYSTNLNDEKLIINYIAKQTGLNRAAYSFKYIDKIPRNSSGKVQYSALE